MLLLAAVELFWRSETARASYVESHARWAWERDRIERAGHPRRTAVLGASRILFSLSLDAFRQRHPHVPIAQLAVAAKGPLATLQSLAHDSDFDGVILLDFNPEHLLPPREDEQADYVDYYRSRWSIDQRLNFLVSNILEPWLVTRHSYYGVNHVVRSFLAERTLPKAPLYVGVRESRQHDADFTLADGDEMRKSRLADMVRRYDYLATTADREWPRTLQSVQAAVEEIHRRGGCVVLIRMPSVKQFLEQDERVFSGPRYWEDVLARLGVHGVHYRQIDGLESIPLPDAEHVDTRDQARFTNALLDELDELGIHDPARPCRPSARTGQPPGRSSAAHPVPRHAAAAGSPE